MATTLLPFRQVHENDVVNLFAFNGSTATRGLVVKLDTSNGWSINDDLGTDTLTTVANTVSDRYNVKARVSTCTSGDVAFGMLMYDVAETDENGEKLIYHPRKAHEMQVSVSGQSIPILTKGIVLIKMDTADANSATIAAGTDAYADDAGIVAATTDASPPVDFNRIGTFLGPVVKEAAADTYGRVLVKLDFNGANDHYAAS